MNKSDAASKARSLCLFCKGAGPFNTVEHIVPESLGNDSHTISGIVCDPCQSYLGREVEKQALEKTSFAFWRTFLGIRTKKGKLPSVDLVPPSKGKLPSTHPANDNFGFTAHTDGSTSLDMFGPLLRDEVRLVLSPWHVHLIGRFLGKIGLELLAAEDLQLALSERFDGLRCYVRRGSANSLWPIYWGPYGEIGDLREQAAGADSEEVFCYQYSIGVTQGEDYVFALLVGTEIFLIRMTNKEPDSSLAQVISDATLRCIHYEDGEFSGKKSK